MDRGNSFANGAGGSGNSINHGMADPRGWLGGYQATVRPWSLYDLIEVTGEPL